MALDVASRQALHRRLVRGAADLLPLNVPAAAAERFRLGDVTATPERLHGGVNRLWRVRTTRGVFAVHALQAGLAVVDRCDRTMALERAAAAAGVPLAAPVEDPTTGRAAAVLRGLAEPVVVHEWVDGEPVHPDRSPPALYRRLGSSVALLHGLDLALAPSTSDLVGHVVPEAEWRTLAAGGRRLGLPWADDLDAAAAELEAGFAVCDRWDRDGGDGRVVGHRDLTSMNLVDVDGTAVLIDWEDAGPIAAGTELGRTALDNLGRDGVLDPALLTGFLGGYAEVAPVPPVGPHWCTLWIRGLLVFAEHCARSCVRGDADEGLLRMQSEVLTWAVPQLRERFAAVPRLVDAFERAVSPA